MTTIYIGMTATRAEKFAREILDSGVDTNSQYEIEIAATDNISNAPIRVVINNDDMEDRNDLPANAVIVEIES